MKNTNAVLLGGVKHGGPGVEKQFLRKFPHLGAKLWLAESAHHDLEFACKQCRLRSKISNNQDMVPCRVRGNH